MFLSLNLKMAELVLPGDTNFIQPLGFLQSASF